MGLAEEFPQPEVLGVVSPGSPQVAGASAVFPQAAVPLSTGGLLGDVLPQPDGPGRKANAWECCGHLVFLALYLYFDDND